MSERGESISAMATFGLSFAAMVAVCLFFWLAEPLVKRPIVPWFPHVLIAIPATSAGFLASWRIWSAFAGSYLGLMAPLGLASALESDPLMLAMFPYFAVMEFVVVLAAVSAGALTRRLLKRSFPQF